MKRLEFLVFFALGLFVLSYAFGLWGDAFETPYFAN